MASHSTGHSLTDRSPEPGVLFARSSPAQERLWHIDRIEPGDPSLNVSVRWHVAGPLDAGVAREAFAALLDRHEALRTSFRLLDGEVVQAVAASVPFKLSEIDLSGLSEADRGREAARIGDLEAKRSFDLTAATLLRGTLLRLGRTESIILVTAHHAVCDGWSMGILAREFVAAYQAIREGGRPRFPELALQYADFAEWQREDLAAGALDDELDYWVLTLRDLPDFEVQPDRHRPAVATSNGASVSILLPRSLTAKIADLARQEETTFFATAYGVLLVLLHRRTGRSDIVLGTQIAARDEVELESVVGLFVNTLLLRTRVSDGQSFLEVMRAGRETFEDAVDRHAVPLAALKEHIRPSQAVGRRSPASVNFIVQRAFVGELANESFRLSGIPSHLPGALYDLNFILVEREDGWRLTCEYSSDLYTEETANALLRAFETTADAVLANPDQQLPRSRQFDPALEVRDGDMPVRPPAGSAGTSDEARLIPRPVGAQPIDVALNHTAQNHRLYRPLARRLGGEHAFVTLQVSDMPAGTAPYRIEDLGKRYCAALVTARPIGPYRLFGFCRSGVLAYEVARQLAAAGHEIELLVLIDCWAPGYFRQLSRVARARFKLRRVVRQLERLRQLGLDGVLAKAEFWLTSTRLWRGAKRLRQGREGGTPPDEDRFWRVTEDLEASVQGYRPGAYRGPVAVFRSEAIPPGWPPDTTLGWRGLVPIDTLCASIPGVGHEGAFSEAGSQAIAASITARRARA